MVLLVTIFVHVRSWTETEKFIEWLGDFLRIWVPHTHLVESPELSSKPTTRFSPRTMKGGKNKDLDCAST